MGKAEYIYLRVAEILLLLLLGAVFYAIHNNMVSVIPIIFCVVGAVCFTIVIEGKLYELFKNQNGK